MQLLQQKQSSVRSRFIFVVLCLLPGVAITRLPYVKGTTFVVECVAMFKVIFTMKNAINIYKLREEL